MTRSFNVRFLGVFFAVMAVLAGATVALAATVFQTEMDDFSVREPLTITGGLAQADGPEYFPGDVIATGNYIVTNEGSSDYGLTASVEFNSDGYPNPHFLITIETRNGIYQQPWQAVLIGSETTLTLEVEIRISPDSPLGQVNNPVLQFERTAPPCDSKGCG